MVENKTLQNKMNYKTNHDNEIVQNKIKEELSNMDLMIDLYCKGVHGKKSEDCEECRELKDYASGRIYKCPHLESKTFCSSCKTHCYSPSMRTKIKAVMRYSGPRLIFHRPDLVFKHMWDTFKNKKR